jgi:hypothetical protein
MPKMIELHKAAIMELYKANDVQVDEQLFTAIVLRPDVPDSHGDIYDKVAVSKASVNYAEYCGNANIQHLMPTDLVTPVHSWISPNDAPLGSGQILEGDWVMTMKVHDPDLWELCKDGTFTGFSVGCSAEVVTIE